MSVNSDVVVVGGGVTGCGVARDLALRGVDVVLVERGRLSSGTTGRSHCLLHSGARYADTDPSSAEACAEENTILKEIAGCCVQDTGGYFVQLESDSSSYFEKKLRECRNAGVGTEVVSGEEARSREPSLSPEVERVIRVPDAVVDPLRLVAANAVDVRRNGAKILTEAEVTEIMEGEVEVRMEGSTETLRADHVVNAAGAWAGEVARKAGYNVDMRPTSGVMVVAEYNGLKSVLNRCRPPSNGDIIVPRKNNIVLGTTSYEVESPDDYPKKEDDIDLVFEECKELIAGLSRNDIEEAYWGVRPLYGSTTRELRDHHLLTHSNWFTSIVGGKLTTYRLMAKEATDHVCATLEIDEGCKTNQKLPLVNDPEGLDSSTRDYMASCPADMGR